MRKLGFGLMRLPLTDPWGTDYAYEVDRRGTEYTLRSFGSDGRDSRTREGAFHDATADLIFSTGSFVTWPEGEAW